jgi:polyisoprenyl-phosphate glycosyltransferase
MPGSGHVAGTLVLIPIYNDWLAVSRLLDGLDRALRSHDVRVRVLLVDDGSTERWPAGFGAVGYDALDRLDVLRLRRNIGHQRAIAIALAYVYEQLQPDTVVIMDGDGEDAPEDVPRLLARARECGNRSVVFAERQKRSESKMFQLFYALYRLLHRLLTGIPVRVGNFSVVPGEQLERLVVVSELWNHYAAAVFKARLPREAIPTQRASRLGGHSRMNFVALVAHGLSALSVHAELIGVRMLMGILAVVGLVCAALGGVVGVRLFSSLAIPGWATTAAGLLVVILFQAIALSVFFVFTVLHARSQPLFIPLRDYQYFVGGTTELFDATRQNTSARAMV